MSGRPIYYVPKDRAAWLHASDPAAEGMPKAIPVGPKIGPREVRDIASRGFPLKEDEAAIALRNKRITVAYQRIGLDLTNLIAELGNERVRAANWCTFGAWSSRTIGATIDPSETHLIVARGTLMRRQIIGLMQRLRRGNHGYVFRSLAAGNRFIFLEVGYAITLLIERFGPFRSTDCRLDPDEEWGRYWDDVSLHVAELRQLDPSWVGSQTADPEMLRVGLRLYFDAMFIHLHLDDYQRLGHTVVEADLKSELILAANLQLSAYEQYRADGYVLTSFAWRGRRAFQRLLVRGTGRSRWPHKYVASWLWTKLVTRFALNLVFPYELIRIGRPLKPPLLPSDTDGELTRRAQLFDRGVLTIDEPRVQALISRFDLDDPEDRKRGAKNWMYYRERMHYITNLMRAYHTYEPLWEVKIFPDLIADQLLAGHLPRSPRSN